MSSLMSVLWVCFVAVTSPLVNSPCRQRTKLQRRSRIIHRGVLRRQCTVSDDGMSDDEVSGHDLDSGLDFDSNSMSLEVTSTDEGRCARRAHSLL